MLIWRKLVFTAVFLAVVILMFNLRPFHWAVLGVLAAPCAYAVVKTFHWARRE